MFFPCANNWPCCMSHRLHLELGDGREFPVRVIRNRRYRRIGLRVTPTALRISAPAAASTREILAVARNHQDWICQTLAALLARRPRDEIHGDPLPRRLPMRALGANWSLRYRDGGKKGIRVRRDEAEVIVVSPSLCTSESRLDALRRFLMHEARSVLVPWLQLLATRHGFEFERTSIRAQRSRWGSCSSSGTISLNYRLLFLPPHLVEYVLLHELAHTVERNHSQRFWSVLEDILSDARQCDRELDACAGLIPAWTETV